MKNKVALISGCSSGIGEDIAVKLSKEGWFVLAGVRKVEDYNSISKISPNIKPIYLDVTKQDHINNCLDEIKREDLNIDVLINNAGIACAGPAELTDVEELKQVYDVNVFGLINLTRAMLPFLRRSKGRIINISSVTGLVASPFMSIYASSKFAVEGFSDSLRRELIRLGVKVSVVEPGPVRTKIWEKGSDLSHSKLQNLTGDLKRSYAVSGRFFREAMEKIEIDALPVSATTKAIYHACTSNSPRARYLVIKNSFFITILRLLPERLADKLLFAIK